MNRLLVRHEVPIGGWTDAISELLRRGKHYAHLDVRRRADGERVLEGLFLDRRHGDATILSSEVPSGTMEVPSTTLVVPGSHWAERKIGDLWGIRFAGHCYWKSLILNDAWPPDVFPLARPTDGVPRPRDTSLATVEGDGVHEIPVGPIHAGVIEPGHFRFSCLGEVVANLEIRLGFLHRGVEQKFQTVPWRHGRHLADCCASDTNVAYALAHAIALEQIAGIPVPARAQALRTLALEIERLANHLGDLAALASDVGLAVLNANFGRLRGDAFGLGSLLGGTRFQTGFVCPGGVAWDFAEARLAPFQQVLATLERDTVEACELFFFNGAVRDRFEEIGVLPAQLAKDFAMVGPAARASHQHHDARTTFAHGLYPEISLEPATESGGDVWARANVRHKELLASLNIVKRLIENLPSGQIVEQLPDRLPGPAVGLGVVESWRGELIHWVTTGESGRIESYTIRDPSFQNWIGLEIAVRGNLVADFPIINKSFNLSYSGSDL